MKFKPRNSAALAAQMRQAGPMRDRRTRRLDEHKADFLEDWRDSLDKIVWADPDIPGNKFSAKWRGYTVVCRRLEEPSDLVWVEGIWKFLPVRDLNTEDLLPLEDQAEFDTRMLRLGFKKE